MRVWLFVLALLVISSSVQAGTLVSGGSVDVRSNYDGFNGLSLVGTWSTTPAVNDRLIVSNALLPPPYGLVDSIEITVPQPKIEQVFRVGSQQKLERLVYVENTYWYFNVPLIGKSKSDLCREDFERDRVNRYGGKPVLPGSSVVALEAQGRCVAQAVLVDSQAGWVGVPNDRGIYFEQNISLDGVGTLRLVRNEREDDLTDRINGVGRATLLNFGEWTNARLTTRNVYAYHQANVIGDSTWRVFSDTQGISPYLSAINRVQAADGIAIIGGTQYSQVKAEYQTGVQLANNEVARVVGVSASLPSAWSNTMGGAIRASGNDVIVPLQRTVFVPQIQFVLAGERFGLFIPVGTPKIVSADSSIRFDETGFGSLNYKVKNIGSDTGSFRLKGFCDGGQVVTDEVEISLGKNQESSGTLRHTAKSQTLDSTEEFDCTLEFVETQTDKKDSKSYEVVVEVKQQCTDGQETEPSFNSQDRKYLVYVLDASCQVKNTKECALSFGEFTKVSGTWECSEIEGGIEPPVEEKGEFNGVVFGIAVAVGIILGGAGSVGVIALVGKKAKKAKGLLIALVLVTFIIGLVGGVISVALIARAIDSAFTLSIGGFI